VNRELDGAGPRARPAARPQGDLFAGQPRSFHLPRADERRIGVVDVGSNSVRMVIFEGGRRCPAMVFNEKIMCGLGAELAATGRLSAEGRARALRALTRFVTLAPGLNVGALAGIATAAVREAADGAEFCRQVTRETGIRLHIASGEDEARLSAQGVLFGDPSAEGLVIDLGGASMEFCPVGGGRTGRGVSVPLGPQRLGSLSGGTEGARAIIRAMMAPLAESFAGSAGRLYLVGGSWRALGRVQLHRSGHPLQVLHEHVVAPEDAHLLARWILAASRSDLDAVPGVASDRVPMLPHAALLLEALLEYFRPDELALSGFGLREGVCYEYLPAHIRREDPLMSTCAGHERTRARAPGFGAELADWVFGAVPPQDSAEERLVRATCHLADVSWRAHPDYRDSACIEVVTRVNVSSIGHPGRAFMAAALLARYHGAKDRADAPLLALLAPDVVARAVRIGALMRLGCTLAGVTPGFLPLCPVTLGDGALRLAPAPEVRPLMGEEVEKRLNQVARAFGAEPAIMAP
jgi:exopolyphosphatase/guanosine-5'-triphosphate,3'-diphosphate pyrophosphatase